MGSGLVFAWASKLYLSKKECTLEVLLIMHLERPIIKSGPRSKENVSPTYYSLSLFLYCSSLQLSLFDSL